MNLLIEYGAPLGAMKGIAQELSPCERAFYQVIAICSQLE